MKASTTPLSRTGSLNHPPRPLARKEGRAKEQGNPLALGPPAGKKTKFLSLADVPPRPSGAPSDSRSIILLNGDDATSTLKKSRSGVVALTRSAHVVSKEPLSRRRVRTEALKSMPVLLPFGQSEGDRSQTTFDAAFKLREETEDEPAVKPSKRSVRKARASDDLPIATIATLLTEQAVPSFASALPTASIAGHPNAHKTRLNESQRARAKHIREGWMKAEGISAREANSRWVDILSTAGWNGDVALLVAKHFAAAGGVQTTRAEQRAGNGNDGLRSFRFSPVAVSETNIDGQSSASAPPSATASAEETSSDKTTDEPLKTRKRRRRSSSVSSAGRPMFFNPFLAQANESTALALLPDQAPKSPAQPAPPVCRAVDTPSVDRPITGTTAAATRSKSDSTGSTALPDLPADDRSINTTAIRILQRLADNELAPEVLLDLVDLFHSNGQAAEVFLSLRDDALKTLWVRRQAKKLLLA